MEWFRENWFFILFLIFFVAIHLFGHGGCGGHREDRGKDRDEEGKGHHGEEKKGRGGCH